MSEGLDTHPKADIGTLLSSKELFAHRKPSDRGLPKTGDKCNIPDGSSEHKERLEEYYRQRRSLLSEQRVEKLGNTVKGEWNPEKDLVELEKELGKFWANMGFVDRNRKWLFPEEALFLMETNVLETWFGGIPLSIQQCYSNFLCKSVSYEEYQVYAHLRRLGFVVNRHRSDLPKYYGASTSPNKSQRKRKYLDENKDTNKQVKVNDDFGSLEERQTHTTTSDRQLLELETDLLGGTPTLSETTCTSADKSKPTVVQTVSTKEFAEDTCMLTLPVKTEHFKSSSNVHLVDFSEIRIPCVFGKDKLELSDLSPELLPNATTCVVDLSKFPLNTKRKRGQEFVTNTPTLPDMSSLEFSFQDYMGKSKYEKIKARNWREYNLKKAAFDSQLNKRSNSPCDVLWSGEVTPLVSPADAMSTASVLEKLSVIKEFDHPLTQRTFGEEPVKISFEAYQPDSKFKKSSPGTPHFRICVQKHSGDPPALSSIMETTGRLDDDVPVLYAVIQSGTIAFYNFSPVSIPTCVSMG